MANPIPAAGIGSNLDVAGLVKSLMNVESQPLDTLNKKEAAVDVKVTALGTLRGSLSTFQGTLSGLEQAAAYTAVKASVGDSDIASASSAAGADVGTHTLEVTNLATSQRLKSDTFTSLTDTVGTGKLTIDYGTYAATGNTFAVNADHGSQTVTIDSAHSSLAGVRDAINAQAGGGVSASIVNDGSGYRLVLASKSSGTANSVRISALDDDTTPSDAAGLSRLAYDPTATVGAGKNLSQVVEAKDAEFLLDGIAIKKPSNTVTDAIAGTTINLLKTNAGAPTTLSVAQDTSGVKTAVDAFVKAYNDVSGVIRSLTKYDPATKTAAPLQGDAGVRALAEKLRDGLSNVVSGVQGGYHALTQVGIALDRNGLLSVDSTKLNNALKTDPHAVQSLFATAASADDPLVSYATSTAATPVGNYALNISRVATHGQAVGASPAVLTIGAANDAMTVTVNGVAASIKLGHATYANAGALATELQKQLNGAASLSGAGIKVDVSENAGVLTLSSSRYGAASKIQLNGGTAQQDLFGATPITTDGVDVGGSFSGGTGVGNGQLLTAANGLAVNVTGGATGDRGNVHFTKGIAVQLDDMISQALGTKGVLTTKSATFAADIKQIGEDRTNLTAKLADKEAAYTKQFSTLDGLITSMQSTMTYLSQQLSALNSNR